jgi:hypothetical protein
MPLTFDFTMISPSIGMDFQTFNYLLNNKKIHLLHLFDKKVI